MPPDPKPQTPTPPDAAKAPDASRLVPIAKVTFRNGEAVPVPGKTASGGTNGLTAKEPTTGEYHAIFLDERRNTVLILFFKPGEKLDRAPTDWLEVHQSVCYLRRKKLGAVA